MKKSRVFPNSKALPSLSKHPLLRLWRTTKDEKERHPIFRRFGMASEPVETH
jgi:hypothetical protein